MEEQEKQKQLYQMSMLKTSKPGPDENAQMTTDESSKSLGSGKNKGPASKNFAEDEIIDFN